MWLTSWWVAWLLNFYGFSHTNCMVFYRTPWTRYGIPWNCISTSGNPMAFHGTPRYSMEFHGIPWNSITTSWNSVELHGIPWNSMDTPWNFMDTPWNSMDTPLHSMELHGYSMDTPWKFREIPWISIDFHGIPWISIDFHVFPWISMEFHGGILHGSPRRTLLSSRWKKKFTPALVSEKGRLNLSPLALFCP